MSQLLLQGRATHVKKTGKSMQANNKHNADNYVPVGA
jgi:hypothetical protein